LLELLQFDQQGAAIFKFHDEVDSPGLVLAVIHPTVSFQTVAEMFLEGGIEAPVRAATKATEVAS
jgi:hypothetical protein